MSSLVDNAAASSSALGVRSASPLATRMTPLPNVTRLPKTPALATPIKNRKRPNLVGPQEIVKVNVHACSEGVKDEDETHHQSFPIHKNHICHYSSFFDAAFNGNFAEARSQEVDLYEVKPETFGIFVNWIYTQDVVSEDGEVPNVHGLIHLWLLADRILVPSLQNQAIDLIERTRQQKGNDRLPSELFPIIYDNTNAESALRLSTGKDRLASVDMQPYHVQEEECESDRAKRRRTQ
ncbi:hypothetical protein DL98DRAFT_89832 [Cadophora sp. DSE1049]|nr:hypothetical protein DL98DRAFT_89832 [Cadophora sp. DSE1049]